MAAVVKRAIRPRHLRTTLSNADIKALLWPILKRMPAYVRLGWALLKEPAIPRRHKALLVATVAYTFSPLHLLASAIPVVAQVDSVALLLLGIRQALAHCPAEVRASHLARLNLLPGQAGKDLNVGLSVALHTLGQIGRPASHKAHFAARVAHGFSRRLLQRITQQAEDVTSVVKSRKGRAVTPWKEEHHGPDFHLD